MYDISDDEEGFVTSDFEIRQRNIGTRLNLVKNNS